MTEQQFLSSQLHESVQAAINQAIERHRKLGESIAVWRDGKVVILSADEIPQILTKLPSQQQ